MTWETWKIYLQILHLLHPCRMYNFIYICGDYWALSMTVLTHFELKFMFVSNIIVVDLQFYSYQGLGICIHDTFIMVRSPPPHPSSISIFKKEKKLFLATAWSYSYVFIKNIRLWTKFGVRKTNNYEKKVSYLNKKQIYHPLLKILHRWNKMYFLNKD